MRVSSIYYYLHASFFVYNLVLSFQSDASRCDSFHYRFQPPLTWVVAVLGMVAASPGMWTARVPPENFTSITLSLWQVFSPSFHPSPTASLSAVSFYLLLGLFQLFLSFMGPLFCPNSTTNLFLSHAAFSVGPYGSSGPGLWSPCCEGLGCWVCRLGSQVRVAHS